MKYFSLLAFLLFCIHISEAQPSAIYRDPQQKLKQAELYFNQRQYSLALPLLQQLEDELLLPAKDAHTLATDEVHYYLYACQLLNNDDRALPLAKQYIAATANQARVQQLAFFLGDYYYRHADYANTVTYLEIAGIDNLTNDLIAQAKFELGYAYFNQQQFDKAKPLFNAIRQLSSDPHYVDANYYYGFIAYKERNYSEALSSFQRVETSPTYGAVVPFYLVEIYYFLGQKDKALEKGTAILKNGNSYYKVELSRLVGHMYFEKKEFANALPYLETYMNGSDKIRREELYELSYCYYSGQQYKRAIDGFKQLSDRTDSLSQSSMYLLGDAYLKTGDKANARSAFGFCASNSSFSQYKEVSRFNYAKLSFELGYQDVALSSFKSFLQDYPQSTYINEARELMVSLLANTSNYREALTLLQSIPTPTETTKRLYPRILYGRAVENINDQQISDADELLNKALKAPYNEQVLPLTYFWKGEIAYRIAKYDDAIRYLNQYLATGHAGQGEVSPKEAKYDLGYSYLQKENFAQALTFFQAVAKNANNNTPSLEQDAYVRVGDCYYMMRDYKKAQANYDLVLSYSWPASDYALYQKAMIAGISNGNEKIKLLQSVAQRYPSSGLVGESNLEIANRLIADERFAEAVPYLNKVLNDPNAVALKPSVYLKSGIVQYNLGKNDQALAQYKQLIAQYPNSSESDEALDNIKAIYIEDGHTNDYIAYVKSTGRNVSTSEADSLTYVAAEVKFNNGDCASATAQFTDYLAKYPTGGYTIPAQFYKSECFNQQKKYKEALEGYTYVVSKGSSRFAEKSALAAARIQYFEFQQYDAAAASFTKLKEWATTDQNQLEALRGLLRSDYQLKQYDVAAAAAKELLQRKGLSTDDKTLASLVTAKNLQLQQQYDQAITGYKNVVALNKGEWAAEARYEIANSYFSLNNQAAAEKAAFEVISKSGSYDLWVTKAYMLLGDIYYKRKDYFNAKATYQSIVENAVQPELKVEAQEKLDQVKEEEGKNSKLGSGQQ